MNSRDIYRNVGEKMLENGYINSPYTLTNDQKVKRETIASMSQALMEYSYEKLCEVTIPEEIVMDLGVILDKIDSHLPQTQKEDFFEHYIHCILNVYNNLENKTILWSAEETDYPEEYPKFEKEGENLEFFKTAMNGSSKETVLWLNKYLSAEYGHKFVKNNAK